MVGRRAGDRDGQLGELERVSVFPVVLSIANRFGGSEPVRPQSRLRTAAGRLVGAAGRRGDDPQRHPPRLRGSRPYRRCGLLRQNAALTERSAPKFVLSLVLVLSE